MKGTGTTVGAAPPFERERSALVQPRPRSMIWIYDLAVYPDPPRDELVGLLDEYVRFVIDDAWPAQQRGEVNTGGMPRIAAIFQRLSRFEPATAAQVALHQEALRELNAFYEARRERLDAVT